MRYEFVSIAVIRWLSDSAEHRVRSRKGSLQFMKERLPALNFFRQQHRKSAAEL